MIRFLQCASCTHLHPVRYGKGYSCTAFPDGIPHAIVYGEVSHRDFYSGDQGITYQKSTKSYERDQVEKIIKLADPELLPYAIRSASIYEVNKWSQDLCLHFAQHPIEYVRAEALHGLARLARKRFHLDRQLVEPVIRSALSESESSTAWAAGLTAALAAEEMLEWDMDARELDLAYIRRWWPDYKGR